MARHQKGILGPLDGKVGDVIGSTWNGIPYFRSRPKSYQDAKTPMQQNNRMKMTVTQKFLKAITPYLRIGFRNYAVGQSAYNAAVSYMRNNALIITEENVSIDPSKVLVSRGLLPCPHGCEARGKEEGTIAFSWDSKKLEEGAEANDIAMPMVYNLSKLEAVYSTDGFLRSDGQASLTYPDKWKGDTLSCFIAFASQNSKAVSESEYLGEIKI